MLRVHRNVLGIHVLVFGVSVRFGTNPKVKVQEALHRMNTFRVPKSFGLALDATRKCFCKEALYTMHAFRVGPH